MRPAQKIRRTLVYGLAVFFYRFLNLIPRKLAVFLGGWVGLAGWKIIRKDQRLIFRHLGLCYNGTMSPQEKVNIGQKFFINSGKNLADFVRLEANYDKEILQAISVEGLEHFDSGYKRGRGVFGITAHLGNFELLAVFLARKGYKIGVISRPLADSNLNQFLVKNREKLGITNFNASDSPVGVVKWLKSGGAVGVLIDTDSTRVKGMYLPVFNRLSKVPVGQSIIALKLGTALIPMACVRDSKNRYKVIIKPEIPINITSDTQKDICTITKSCCFELEKLIKQYPDQWIWMHNRWKSRPEENRA